MGAGLIVKKTWYFQLSVILKLFFDFESELLIIVQYKNLSVNLSLPVSACIH